MSTTMDPEKLGDLYRFLGDRVLLGSLAVLNGYVTAEQLEACLAEQRSSPERRPLGAILLAHGYVTAAQLAEMERQQEEMRGFDAPAPPPPGVASDRVIGHYALVEPIGGGRTGVVWKAWDTKLRRWVALKEARPDADFPRERFLREARAAAKLRHPNLVEALEVGRHEGRDYLVMNYVEGRTLDQERLDLRQAASVIADICDAVHALHSAGILHRDIKPQNILLDASGKAYLGDFGIARDAANPAMTLEGTVLGTPLYMAPEQASPRTGPVSEASDVYGLGATLYHLATGQAPFLSQEDLLTLVEKLLRDAPTRPRQVNPAVPEELEFIILHALEKHPADRYGSAAEMAEDLRRFLRGEPLRARPEGALSRGAKWLRRNPRLAAAVVAAVAGASLAAGVGLYHLSSVRREEAYLKAYQEGIELWRRGSPETAAEALARFDRAAGLSPGRPEPWLMRGRCLLLLRRGAEAEESWTNALRQDPAFGPALLERGKYAVGAYVRLRLPPPARVSGGRVRFGPPEPEGPEDRTWRQKGEADLARARGAPGLDATELRYLEGALAYGRGRYAEAAAALGEHAARNPWDVAALALYAAAAYRAGEFARAEEALGRAIALEPRADRFHARGDTRYVLGRFAEAVEDYDRALRLGAPQAEVLCNRGLALQAQGKLAEAVADYTEAAKAEPGLARAYNNRGTARAEQLDLAGAEKDFERALEANEFYAEAYNNLGNVLLLQGRVDEALAQYDLALGCNPEYVEAHLHRGLARRKKGEAKGALEDFEAAVELDRENPEILLELAVARREGGQEPGAVEALRRALACAPANWPRRPRAEQLLREWTR